MSPPVRDAFPKLGVIFMPSSQQLAYAFAFPVLAFLFGIGASQRRAFGGLRLVYFLALLVVASGLASCTGS
jgi:hypothetical protein